MSDSSSSEGCYPQRGSVPRMKVEEAKCEPGRAIKQAAKQVGDSVIGTVEGKKAKINQ